MKKSPAKYELVGDFLAGVKKKYYFCTENQNNRNYEQTEFVQNHRNDCNRLGDVRSYRPWLHVLQRHENHHHAVAVFPAR